MKDKNFRDLLIAAIILCSCVTWASSRRHYYRHSSSQRSRHRRQGAKLYLPSSYVIPGGEGHGAWGAWSDPTPCSRTCGGGVSSQERICLEDDTVGRPSRCSGGNKKYFSCNTQDCPEGAKDFRSEQCSQYDSVPFREVLYEWIPYTKGSNPCELNCMPRGERFYYTYNQKVIDGTPCNSEDLDVCVDGACLPVGCDLMLGSGAVEDKCRECRGNGSSCKTIQDINTDPNLILGYNDILLIPAGATSIFIREVAASNNYLAIRALTGAKYYLNGEYRIDFPRALDFAGATWHYERSGQGLPAPDIIRCLGPTNESVYISLLLLDRNVGVKYEYSIPKDLVPPPDEQYTWAFKDFSQCSATCGGGYQTRDVYCKSRSDLKEADINLCEHYQRPVDNQTCATTPCAARWVEGPWGKCSKPCGDGGTQDRQITCQKIIANGLPTLVSDDECIAAAGEKPALYRKCNVGGKCPQWFTGPWLPCDKLCGEGKQRRNVTCFQKVEGKIEVLSDDQCAETKPATDKGCIVHPCEGVDWVLSDWSGCDSCLSNERTRTAQCASKSQDIFDSSFCSNHPKPVLSEPCDRTLLPACDVQWYASQWSNCSTKCGEGKQSRRVFCGMFDGESIVKVEETRCNASDKYDDSKPCKLEGEECPAEWHAGPWSACTKECGGGEQFRKVFCLQGNKTAATDKCGEESIQDTSQSCNTGPCDADETIGVKGSTQPLFEDETSGEDELDECTDADYEDFEESGLESDDAATEAGSTESSPTESTSTGTTETETETGSTQTTGDDLFSSETPGTASTGTTSTDFLGEASGDGEGASSSDSTESTGSESSTVDVSSATKVTEHSTVESSSISTAEQGSTVDVSTTDGPSIETSTLDSSTTDSSTTFTTTTDSSTIDSSTSDSSTTDSSTLESSTPASSTDDSSTIDSSSTVTLTTDSSTTDSSTMKSTTDGSTADTSTASTTEGSTSATDNTASTESQTTPTGASTEEGTASTGSTGTTENSTEETSSTSETGSTEDTSGSETTSSWSWATTIGKFTKGPRKCRPRTAKSKCAQSQFGCCFDNFTAAAGPFDAGCPQPITCKESKYGCCEDGVSAAQGDHFYGCVPIPCKETLFGCCKSDKRTPAQGNNQEGCPPPPPACKKTKFGCCVDGKTAATGPNHEGCSASTLPDIDVRTPGCAEEELGCCHDNHTYKTEEGCPCNATQYGCCPDKITAAQGSDYQGCALSCNQTKFGCCPDNKTPAHGYLGEGCCINSQYGCCPDNVVPARGPNGYGCSCQDSPYGCCPDNVSSAKGQDNEGCGCDQTQHGCCPDNHTPAEGPNFEGCPCHTHQFGCCLDGVTPARGPQNLGCRCQDTQFGCCPDEKTPAQGPNQMGCNCDASKYGCCPDGVTAAGGDKFLGCTDVPVNLQESCGLDKDLGPCRNYTVRWFFDMEYGGCSRFWYGGCEGNGNRFNSQDECQDTCVAPQGKDVCKLPKVKGGCDGHMPRWSYDGSREQCGQFIYGGCLGNNNNFEKREDCQSLCEKPKAEDACQLPTETGPCAGNFVRWGYSNEQKRCNQFVWGGCEGNDNRFGSEAACLHACHTPGTLQDECKLPREVGNCTETVPKWNFDERENRCVPFYYSGCGGNQNAFDSESECKRTCPEKIVKDLCTLPATLGECANYQERWYYNTAEKRCRQFYFGGCGGNGNNFISQGECEQRCAIKTATEPTRPTRPTRPTTQTHIFTPDDCFLSADSGPCLDPEQRWWYDPRIGSCFQFTYGGCGGNGNNFPSQRHCDHFCGQAQDVCQLPMRVGPCEDSIQQYYYDRSTDSCSQFTYSGCEGNANRFNSKIECEQRCVRQPTTPVRPASTSPSYQTPPNYPEEERPECREPASLGPCGESVLAWYYNPMTAACTLYYGGACIEANRYGTEEECERSCGRFTDIDVCLYPLDPGEGVARIPKYYFDRDRSQCVSYEYRGSGGGPNRFTTYEECESICRGRFPTSPTTPKPDENEIGVDENPHNKPNVCGELSLYCESLVCEFGVITVLDAYGCPKCSCAEPCSRVTCGPDETCAIQPYTDTDGIRKYVGTCRPIDPNYGPPAAPVVSETETEPEVSSGEGGIAVLRCVVTGNPPPTITWQRGSITIDGTTGRYTILTDGALQIVSLYRNDSGIYICVADNGIGDPVRKEINLVVNEPTEIPAAIAGEPYAELVGTINEPLRLRCPAYGYPEPTVSWIRGKTMVLDDPLFEQSPDYSLLIRTLTYELLGEYICEAYNAVEGFKPNTWTVTVKAPRPYYEQRSSPYWIESAPRVTTSRPTYAPPTAQTRVAPVTPVFRVPVRTQIASDVTEFAVGSDLTLPCDVDGYPEPEVTWLKDGAPLENSDKIQISSNHRLTITGVSSDDSGVYTCFARNQYSEFKASLQIIVQGVYIRSDCTDSPFFANCQLIVQTNYCRHQYYANFCCRSCTLAGQLRENEVPSAPSYPKYRTNTNSRK